MQYVLISEKGSVIARSRLKAFLELRQKRYKRSRIITEKDLKDELIVRKRQISKARQVPNRQLQRKRVAPKARKVQQPTKLQHAGIANLLGSSVIQYLFYYPKTQIVQVRIGASRRNTTNGYYKGIPKSVFDGWKAGRATCKTSDKSGLKRWKKGDTPSLGAFYNANIKGRYTFTKGVYNGP